ncbi:38555_t:CDS:2, partial [Gigaspora margarita]
SCALLETCTDLKEMEDINNIDISTIFNNEEENIIDIDNESETITITDRKNLNLIYYKILICKSIKQLNNWKHNKAVSFLQEKYNLLSVKNELVEDLTNEEENENQMKLFSIMFESDERSTLVKNEVDRYLKIDQVSTKTNPLKWWQDIQEELPILA